MKSLVRRDDYMVSIDLNQAFYHVPLATNQRQYFAFDLWENVTVSNAYHLNLLQVHIYLRKFFVQ